MTSMLAGSGLSEGGRVARMSALGARQGGGGGDLGKAVGAGRGGAGDRGRSVEAVERDAQVRDVEVEGGADAGALQVGGGRDRDLVGGHEELLEAGARRVAGGADVDAARAREQRVEFGDAEGEVGGGAVERDVERPLERADGRGDVEVGAPGEVEAGERAEAAEVVGGERGRHLCREEVCGALHGARTGQVDAGPGEGQRLDLKRAVADAGDGEAARDAGADRLGKCCVGQGEGVGGVSNVGGEAPVGAVAGGDDDACAVEGEGGDGDGGAAEIGEGEGALPLVAGARIEGHVEVDRVHEGARPGAGQQDGRAVRPGDAAREVERQRPAVRRDFGGTGELHRLRLDLEGAQREGAGRVASALHREARGGAEELGIVAGGEGGEIAGYVEPQILRGPGVGFDGDEAEFAGDPFGAVGRDRECGGVVVDRRLAVQDQPHRGAPGDAEGAGDDAVRFLGQIEGQRQDAGVVGVGARHLEAADRGVEALCGDVGAALAARQRHLTVDGKGVFGAEQRLAQHDPVGADLGDVDADGQVGQGKAERCGLGVGEFGRLGAEGRADHLDDARRHLLHVDAAAEQGRAVPVEHQILGAQPDALAVGDGEEADGRAAAEGAGKALDPDGGALVRQVVLDQALDEADVAVLLGFLRGERGGEEGGGQGEGNEAHQNDCPMPM